MFKSVSTAWSLSVFRKIPHRRRLQRVSFPNFFFFDSLHVSRHKSLLSANSFKKNGPISKPFKRGLNWFVIFRFRLALPLVIFLPLEWNETWKWILSLRQIDNEIQKVGGATQGDYYWYNWQWSECEIKSWRNIIHHYRMAEKTFFSNDDEGTEWQLRWLWKRSKAVLSF